ncbi:siderophore-interacting protein [Pokkaliibacter sp. CJK22405]|uniref:siderophore-interacting protein n=1 Tax=Pokkaliibacter sp. CJK22405 TaxID=3384615 RepID=UPI0039851449
MAGPGMRLLEVVASERITPNMQRITLGGESMHDFPEGKESANLKLLLPRAWQKQPVLEAFRTKSPESPIVRTYTVRSFDAVNKHLVIDFAMHGDGGPASNWAKHAAVGDTIGVAGPGPIKLDPSHCEWFLVMADMTGLPAASAFLEKLPATAKGMAMFEITAEEDAQKLNVPEGIEVHWRVHAHPHNPSYAMLDVARALDWPESMDNVCVFAAAEAHGVKALRDHVLKERGVPRAQTYLSPYWKIGLVEDQHQQLKREEAKAEEA